MTAPHPAAAVVHPALAVALAEAGASPAVVAAATQRFTDWRVAPGALERTMIAWQRERPWRRLRWPTDHPSAEHAARAIVAACVEAERVGLLERPCREVGR